jgi:hypothetical protein
MHDELGPALCASAICMLIWGGMAAGAGALAHWRMVRVERDLGTQALPAHEWPQLWYAIAAIAWPFAAVLAAVGLFRRAWARAGRNTFWILLAHFSVTTIGATVSMIFDAQHSGPGIGVVFMACGMVLFGATLAMIMTWRFTSARADRIASEPHEAEAKEPSTLERLAIYIGTVMAWPIGIAAAVVYSKPHNVRVGMGALRVTALVFTAISWAVCIGISVLVITHPM